MIRMMLLLMLGTVLMANGCENKEIEQGIAGKVVWIEGNQMPVIIDDSKPGSARQRPEPKGIVRDIYIYELTSQKQASGNGVFYSDIQTKLVEKVTSNEEGLFAVSLPAGRYSVFVQEKQGLFANQMDGQGNINPVEVKEKEITPVRLDINYEAAY